MIEESTHSIPSARASGINKKLAVEIYGQLMNGKMLNRHTPIEGTLKYNPLFDEVYKHFDSYQYHYSLNGYELSKRLPKSPCVIQAGTH